MNQLDHLIEEIKTMSKKELCDLSAQLLISLIDSRDKAMILRNVDLRYAELMSIDTGDLVVCSEFRADDLGL